MLNDKELIKIAREDGDSIKNLMDDKTTIVKFIRHFNLKPGNILVPNYLIYYIYKTKWSIQGNKISKIDFMRRFSKIFEQKRKTKTRFYKLENNPFSEYDLKAAKKYDKKFNKIKKIKKIESKTTKSR
jgi:hypothetical protein